MNKTDIDTIIKIIYPNDEDFEKPIISPAYLKKELEALALEQESCNTLKLDEMLEDAYEHGYQQARHDYEAPLCEDAIDRRALRAQFNHLDEVYEGMSEEERREAYIYELIIGAIDAALPVTPKLTECEDAISRQAMLDGLASIAKVKAKSDAQKALMGRVMFFTEQLPSVNPKQKTLEWIPVKDPYTELPKDSMLWVTRDYCCGCRWVDTVCYGITEWSDPIDDVVAYALYEEPAPYKEGESE